MKSSEIRSRFLKYFEKNGHKILPGSSLVPADPTVLLTLAGMLQFKPIFLGQESPKHKRVTTVQKCVRTNDIEQVGRTARHHTFFEMLGNFSFGDYFKKEAIKFAWELLTLEFKLPTSKLLIAVYEKDDEAFALWNKELGLPLEKIIRLGEDNNFWAVGPTGPCGPCSEIYYDFGPARGCGKPDCKPGCDCDRFLEVWNLVFIQFNRNEKGELVPLKQKGIDTGMGLERIASILQGVESNFETDLFVPLIDKIKEKTELKNPSPISIRIIADHARAVAHLIGDGVIPENAGRGYVLRRLIRRAVRHGRLLGIAGPFLYLLAEEVIGQIKDIYPVLGQKDKLISKVVRTEEDNFLATLEQGMSLFKEIVAQHKEDKVIPGATVFKLHDTYGFPVELSREIAADEGYRLDEKGFEMEMEKQKERARSAGIPAEKKKQKLAVLNLERFGETKFTGYEKTSEETKLLAVFPEEKFVVLEKTPFYGESGGQVGDTGILAFGKKEIRVVDALLTTGGTVVHEVDKTEGLNENMKVVATIDAAKRKATEIHHTSTPLLHRALREVLGDHVKQAGSYVGPEKLRFDFSHFAGLSPEELGEVEAKVNQKIKEKMKVEVLQKTYQEAVKMGAMALFGEKYGDKVRVLKIGDYSLELCGGTHVKTTGEILFFKVVSEGALGAGIRRIEAIAGQAAKVYVTYHAKSLHDEVEALIQRYRLLEMEKERAGGNKFTETRIFEIEVTEIQSLMQAVDKQDSTNVRKFLEHLQGRVDWLKERIAKSEKEINELKLKAVVKDAAAYLSEMMAVGGTKVLAKEFKDYSMEMLRSISDAVQREAKSGVIILLSVLAGRVIFLVTVTPDLVGQGYSAKKISEAMAPLIQGKGGGREAKAEGGGKDPARVKEALAKAVESVGKQA
ncbi:MAG: alanine--tRNA ligase [Candidatus Margulisbacteria bacterium]|nr:alanine--tRNA ligase [Candidatus Margulisiibacteriota bacterium]